MTRTSCKVMVNKLNRPLLLFSEFSPYKKKKCLNLAALWQAKLSLINNYTPMMKYILHLFSIFKETYLSQSVDSSATNFGNYLKEGPPSTPVLIDMLQIKNYFSSPSSSWLIIWRLLRNYKSTHTCKFLHMINVRKFNNFYDGI